MGSFRDDVTRYNEEGAVSVGILGPGREDIYSHAHSNGIWHKAEFKIEVARVDGTIYKKQMSLQSEVRWSNE